MERFDVSPIKINHLAFKLSKSGDQDMFMDKQTKLAIMVIIITF